MRTFSLFWICLTCASHGRRLQGSGDEPIMPEDKYLAEYGLVYDHIGMLQDHERMGAYHRAIKENAKAHFKGKTVLDVGTGTGVLAIWAAQAGAAKVYAVEATAVAVHTKTMVNAHGFEGTVVVLQGKMEEVELPEKVDVIVSEWMGYFLLRESMVQSVLYARDRWLKQTGVMYPSHASILLATLREPGFSELRAREFKSEMEGWGNIAAELKTLYSLDYEALRKTIEKENIDFMYRQTWQSRLGGNAVVGTPQTLLSVDMKNTTVEELFGWHRTVQLDPPPTGVTGLDPQPVDLLCGWFYVRFSAEGSDRESFLSTSPFDTPTHWKQTTFTLDPPLAPPYNIYVALEQSRKSHHDLNVTMAYQGSEGVEMSVNYAITSTVRNEARSDFDATAKA